VNEAISSDVCIARPSQTIQEAARMMSEIDAGVLPVGENEELVGIIIVLRIGARRRTFAVGKGRRIGRFPTA
jgi:CBS domain-containing protein